ncbi:MAG TPA: 50S ribosomal protein L20 [Dehalococcoidales bacterium]|jgi:large subunit ribosomal protein L20|nr:50S ribosomal protein L20 [Dehalococcoidales bacterium]
MPRVKRGVTTHQRHKSVLALTKGHRASKHKLIKRAKESMIKSLSYAYAHRRERKGDMRRLWIVRVNAACRLQGMNYSDLIDGLKKSGVIVNRKLLADMAVQEPETFAQMVTIAKQQS